MSADTDEARDDERWIAKVLIAICDNAQSVTHNSDDLTVPSRVGVTEAARIVGPILAEVEARADRTEAEAALLRHGWRTCHRRHLEELEARGAAEARAEGLAAQVAAVEKLCDEAERGEGIIVTPGFTTYYSVDTGLLRRALAARPVTDDKAGDR